MLRHCASRFVVVVYVLVVAGTSTAGRLRSVSFRWIDRTGGSRRRAYPAIFSAALYSRCNRSCSRRVYRNNAVQIRVRRTVWRRCQFPWRITFRYRVFSFPPGKKGTGAARPTARTPVHVSRVDGTNFESAGEIRRARCEFVIAQRGPLYHRQAICVSVILSAMWSFPCMTRSFDEATNNTRLRKTPAIVPTGFQSSTP